MRYALILLLGCVASSVSQANELVAAARAQVGVTLAYDSRYVRLDYPGGDIDLARGVCTDVIVRAYRALGLDLQRAVHEDMRKNWTAYPKFWGLRGPDRNIDHRRVPNLATWFARHGLTLPVSDVAAEYLAGDIVTWRLASGVPHIGLVSDRRGASEVPLIIHNIGAGAREEDVLFAHVITGHFRHLVPPP